jgi:hypothetical protein
MYTTLQQKEEKETKDLATVINTFELQHNPLQRQHPNTKFSKSDASEKETLHNHHRRPIIVLDFHPGESPPSQKMPSTRPFLGTTI